MFSDRRSKKVILVAHCVLNQNAKIDRCAYYPGAMRETAQFLLDSGLGIVQMPCPELLCLGLDRQVDPHAITTIESEDDRVAERMQEPRVKSYCRRIARDLTNQVVQYRQNGFTVVGVLGINGSPTCGVETSWQFGIEKAGPGVLIQSLSIECHKRNLTLSMRGIKAKDPESAVEVLQALLQEKGES